MNHFAKFPGAVVAGQLSSFQAAPDGLLQICREVGIPIVFVREFGPRASVAKGSWKLLERLVEPGGGRSWSPTLEVSENDRPLCVKLEVFRGPLAQLVEQLTLNQ